MNLIAYQLEKRLKQSLNRNPDPFISDDELESNANLKQTFDKQSNMDVALRILQECTAKGYDRIKKKLCEMFNLDLPSSYTLMKELPLDVELVAIEITLDDETVRQKDDLVNGRNPTLLKKEGFDFKSVLEKASSFFNEKKKTIKLIGAKLKGTYVEYCNILLDKMEKRHGSMKADDQVLFINSFDGAEVFRNNKQSAGVISYNTSLLVPRLIQERKMSPHASKYCLTWQQIRGKEDLRTITCSTSEYFKHRRRIETNADGVTLKHLTSTNERFVYDMHDGKFLYSMLACSHYKRKYHRFLWCKCKKGEGVMGYHVNLKGKVIDPAGKPVENWKEQGMQHSCTLITDEEYRELFKKSMKRFYESNETDEERHKVWCDESNFGVTHFGIDCDLFDISSIRFDTFHMMSSIIKQVMTCLREYILEQSPDIYESFSKNVLGKIYNEYLIHVWNNRMKLSGFQGKECSSFVQNIENIIVPYLKENMMQCNRQQNIIKLLKLLKKIDKFVRMTYIDVEEDEYKEMMTEFNDNVKNFYKYGRKLGMVKEEEEIFYFHVLRFYMPNIVETTYSRHKLGVGIFSMQAFERRNKESKNLFLKFCTLNRNTPAFLINNLKRLSLTFQYDMEST
mmetsp:Transcript_26810/g.33062  ORF Transcript_26810/g.33062 Transcript_26810/m.33062 type:complete len:623 (+) Transcript_26810:1317-3185(+)